MALKVRSTDRLPDRFSSTVLLPSTRVRLVVGLEIDDTTIFQLTFKPETAPSNKTCKEWFPEW